MSRECFGMIAAFVLSSLSVFAQAGTSGPRHEPVATPRAILGRLPAPPKDAHESVRRCPKLWLDIAVEPVEKELEAALRTNSAAGPGAASLDRNNWKKITESERRWKSESKKFDDELKRLQQKYDENNPCAKSNDPQCPDRMNAEWNAGILKAVDLYLREARLIWNDYSDTVKIMLNDGPDERNFASYDLVKTLLSKSDACFTAQYLDFLNKK
jgi:hypothetical protein